MSEHDFNPLEGDQDQDEIKVDELAILKQRAKLLGVTFSNNIGVDALREKIEAKMNEDAAAAQTKSETSLPTPPADPVEQGEDGEVPAPTQATTPQVTAAPVVKEKKLTLRNMMIRDNMKLVRIRLTCLDPKKKEWPGEILTVANEHLGTVSKYIPFGEATDNGYHVPYCIYKMLKNRKFLSIRTYKDRSNGNQIKVEQRWANEFAIEVLDPLTPDELAKLAAAQTAAGTI